MNGMSESIYAIKSYESKTRVKLFAKRQSPGCEFIFATMQNSP